MYLGIDTSCYTTSVAVVSSLGEVVADKRRLLEVKQGNRGLRQSEGVFQHIKNLPLLVEEIKEFLPMIKAVAVSSKPRNQEDSYMPVFLAGESFAKAVAASLSGGTTEILKVCGEKTEIIGKTLDIPAGQLIDRTGVMCGLKFPCGKEMDQFAMQTDIKLPVSVKGVDINFSGAEIQAERLYKSGVPAEEIYRAVFDCIARSLEKAIKNAGDFDVLPVGGVSSNSKIREHLLKALGEKVHFAERVFMTDNAVGVAHICRERHI